MRAPKMSIVLEKPKLWLRAAARLGKVKSDKGVRKALIVRKSLLASSYCSGKANEIVSHPQAVTKLMVKAFPSPPRTRPTFCTSRVSGIRNSRDGPMRKGATPTMKLPTIRKGSLEVRSGTNNKLVFTMAQAAVKKRMNRPISR